MRLLACLLALAACAFPATAAGGSFVRSSLEDVGLPLRPRLLVMYGVPTTGLAP
jgi:hypothetical protein